MAEATDSCKMLQMNSSLWSNLPRDPLQEALARLPLRSLAQYRAVCKTWNAEIGGIWKCGATLRSTASVMEEDADKYWLVFPDGFCYNPTMNKSHQIKFFASHQVKKVLATSGGMMLCAMSSCWANGESKLSVGNPFKANCWTPLPERPPRLYSDHADNEPVGFRIVVDRDSHTFKVVIVISWGDYRSPLESHLYDSQSKNWKVIEPRRRLVDSEELPLRPYRGGACYKNHLLYNANPTNPAEVNFIMAFNLKAETWRAVKLPDRDFYYCHVVVYGARMFITGENARSTRVVIFEFQKRSEELDDLDGTWLMVGSLDRRLQEKALQTWQGALPICLKSGSNTTRVPILIACSATINGGQILLFHVDENTWYKVHESKQGRWREDYEIYEAMVFTPRLEACACT